MSLIQLLKFKKMGNKAFQNASFGNALFPNEVLGLQLPNFSHGKDCQNSWIPIW